MRAALVLLALLALVRLAVAALVPLSPDEAYYWVWSRAPAAGYFDHPPMVALFIRAGTAIAGIDRSGVRLLSPVSALLGSALLAGAGRDLLDLPPSRAWAAALMLNATLMVGAGAVTMTPDTPLLLFWTACLSCAGRYRATARGAWLVATGAALGLAFCSKYTAFLLVPALAIWLFGRSGVALLRDRWTWLAGLVSLAVVAPVLAWNATHGFASFARQGGRAGLSFSPRMPRYLAELVLGQVGLATPLLFLLFCLGAVHLARRSVSRDGDGARLVLASLLVPLAVFVEHALGARVQANWPSVLYPSASLGAACLPVPHRSWRAPGPAIVLGLAVTLLVYVQAASGVFGLPARFDPTVGRLAGWRSLAAATGRLAAGRPIAADDYAVAAMLAWERAAPTVIGVDPRWRLFALPHPTLAGTPVLLVRSARRGDPPDAAIWRDAEPLAILPRGRGGETAERYRIFSARAFSTADARLPEPPALKPR